MKSQSTAAYKSLKEVSEHLGEPPHVLRFWESRFPEISPVKRAGGRRYFCESDILLLQGIMVLTRELGYTIRGVQRILREQGVEQVMQIGTGDATALPLAESAATTNGAEPDAAAPRTSQAAQLRSILVELRGIAKKLRAQ